MKKISLIFSILGLVIFLPVHGVGRTLESFAPESQKEEFRQRYEQARQAGASPTYLRQLNQQFYSNPLPASGPINQINNGLAPPKTITGGKQ